MEGDDDEVYKTKKKGKKTKNDIDDDDDDKNKKKIKQAKNNLRDESDEENYKKQDKKGNNDKVRDKSPPSVIFFKTITF